MQSTPSKPPHGPVSLDYFFDASSSMETSEMEVMNEVLSGSIPWVALNPSSYLLHCQPWQWWTQCRQLTTPLFNTKRKKEIDGKWYVCHPSMHHSSTLPSEDLLWEGMMKLVYMIMRNRRSNLPQFHPLTLSIKLPRCWHFFFFYFFN